MRRETKGGKGKLKGGWGLGRGISVKVVTNRVGKRWERGWVQGHNWQINTQVADHLTIKLTCRTTELGGGGGGGEGGGKYFK